MMGRNIMLSIGFKSFLGKNCTGKRQRSLREWKAAWDPQQCVKLLAAQPLPAEPWLGCASTRPRHWGRRRGLPPSPGSLPHWSPRCCCGSSPADPREKHSSHSPGASGWMAVGSDTVTGSETACSEEGRIQVANSAGNYGGLGPALVLSQHLTFTGLSVAENASCRAQQASLHISSVNTGPAVTRTYLPEETRRLKSIHFTAA